MKKKIYTEPYNVQVNKDQLEAAKAKVNLPEAFRDLVDKITKSKVCPCCGNLLKGK